MNDTHGVEGKGWYAFDLDGTLAVYDKWQGIDHIGEPVKPMVDLIKKMHEEGKVVKILTARVAPRKRDDGTMGEQFVQVCFDCQAPNTIPSTDGHPPRRDQIRYAREFIADWCLKHLGFLPEITHEKDHLMLMLFDDRVKQVIPNEGFLLEDLYRECGEKLKKFHADNGWLLAELESKRSGFWAGFGLAVLVFVFSGLCVEAYEKWFGPEKEPARVRMEKAHDAICDLLREWPVEYKESK